VKTLAVAHRPTAAPDGVLVQQAAAGGGESYAALYDRYSEQVYNYCLRLTGSPDDAADATQDAFVNVLARLQHDERPVLDFASYLFAAARNESYALMRRRSRTHPSEEVPEPAVREPDVHTEPERAVLLQDSQEAVREANAKLAPRHREVLALREVADRSYDEIGQIMGISENAAAQLIWRARSKLKEALTAGAVASVVAASEDCETAQVLLNRLHDGEPVSDEDQRWLDEHLDECDRCRAARGMLVEVGTSYRAWAPVAVLAALRPEVLTQAGHAVGADWSAVAGKAAGSTHGAVIGTASVAIVAATGLAIAGLLNNDDSVTREAAPMPLPAVGAAAKPPPKHEPKAKPALVKRVVKPTPPSPRVVPASVKPAPKAAPAPHNPPPDKPAPKTAPKPRATPPPQQTTPPPPRPAGPCTFPGHGNGPGGCPPGHGGIPPGQGGEPPGQVGKSTLRGKVGKTTPPGRVGKATPRGRLGKPANSH
jgi:RNA polymerase sigma factor (sigma-70 family)